jgi:hypothetical protein
MSKQLRRIRRTWARFAPWAALVLTAVILLISVYWCRGRFHIPYCTLVNEGILICFIWMIAFWPKMQERDPAILVTVGALTAGTVSFVATLALAFFLSDRARFNYLESSGLNSKRNDFAHGREFNQKPSALQPGKVVILEQDDLAKFEFSAMQFDLPAHLLPRSESEVDVVILISWKQKREGGYTNGATAFSWSAEVYGVDWRSKTVAQSTVFQGTPPPKRTNNPTAANGGKPEDQVRHWVQSLLAN